MTIEIILDIETLPTSRADIKARCVKDVAPPGNYKKPETIDQWWASEGDAKKEEAVARTALDGTWGEVLCIGFAVNDFPVEIITGDTEAELLENFGRELNLQCQQEMSSGDQWQVMARWIGHNIIDFDLRFLWQRSKLLRVTFPFHLPTQRYDSHVYDTMREWKGYKDLISQKDLELAFGITRNDPLPNGGGDVFQAYKEGRIDDIKEHCRLDIEGLRTIYRRMKS
jgi:hypothetical protein